MTSSGMTKVSCTMSATEMRFVLVVSRHRDIAADQYAK